MNYIITTDTHFEHHNILDFGQRPENFEQIILDNLEKVASYNAILIHLGDICWKRDRFWNRQLTSLPFRKKWLIKGNHDNKSDEWYLSNGWDFVGERIYLKYDSKDIVLSHKPVELQSEFINFHGHFHNLLVYKIMEKDGELYRIWCQENHHLLHLEHEYKPFLLSGIINEFKKNNDSKE